MEFDATIIGTQGDDVIRGTERDRTWSSASAATTGSGALAATTCADRRATSGATVVIAVSDVPRSGATGPPTGPQGGDAGAAGPISLRAEPGPAVTVKGLMWFSVALIVVVAVLSLLGLV